MSDNALPHFKWWHRWLMYAFSQLIALCGIAMLIYGVKECMALANALQTLPPEIEVNTAMSACPPLGIGLIAFGVLAWLPRTADKSRIRPIRITRGREVDPGAVIIGIMLAMFLVYIIAGVALRVGTSNMLSERGYSEQIERVSPSSRYITSRWTRAGG